MRTSLGVFFGEKNSAWTSIRLDVDRPDVGDMDPCPFGELTSTVRDMLLLAFGRSDPGRSCSRGKGPGRLEAAAAI